MIYLPIEIGDTILAGKFRNKKIVVKEIGVDLHGGPTVNGRPILQIRIPKLYNTSKGITEMATKVKIKKDNGKYNLYRCTADGDEETPVNKFPYDTEEQAITTAIYKGFDVGGQAPKSRKTYLIKNEEIPRVKYDKPKEIELGIEREVKLENLIRKMIKESDPPIDDLSNYNKVKTKGPDQYSNEGILNANKKMTALAKYYIEHVDKNLTNVSGDKHKLQSFIDKKLSSFNHWDGIERKYKSVPH